jgi:hypothetical protein
MLTYQYVEDYLELLGGYEVNSPSALLYPSNKQISLARYDVAIVDSMSSHTVFGGALTDRQAELCIKIILKYRRQFAKINVDVTPVETPVFRHPPRKLDRSCRIWLEGEDILVKFPYNQERIADLREMKSSGQGRSKWDHDNKLWRLGITEYNINYIVTWGQSHNFEIDTKVIDLFNLILASESQIYEIKLIKTAQGYKITNAADSLIEYVATHVGDDLIRLIDYAGILGYIVDTDLLVEASIKYGPALEHIGTKRQVHLEPRQELAEWLFDYAELTNRYPICIYDPSPLPINQSLLDLSRFKDEDIVKFDLNGKTKTSNYDPYNVKVIYAKKLPKAWTFPIPLLVSTQQMMHGGHKLDWINRAEKIVYFCHAQLRENN